MYLSLKSLEYSTIYFRSDIKIKWRVISICHLLIDSWNLLSQLLNSSWEIAFSFSLQWHLTYLINDCLIWIRFHARLILEINRLKLDQHAASLLWLGIWYDHKASSLWWWWPIEFINLFVLEHGINIPFVFATHNLMNTILYQSWSTFLGINNRYFFGRWKITTARQNRAFVNFDRFLQLEFKFEWVNQHLMFLENWESLHKIFTLFSDLHSDWTSSNFILLWSLTR